jgi:hypothetical protein
MTLNFGFLPTNNKKLKEQSYSIENLSQSQSNSKLQKKTTSISQIQSSKNIFQLSGANSMKKFKEDGSLNDFKKKDPEKVKKFKKFKTLEDMYYADSKEKNHYTIRDVGRPSPDPTKPRILSKIDKENTFQNRRFQKVFDEDYKFDLLTHKRISTDVFSKKKKTNEYILSSNPKQLYNSSGLDNRTP